MANWDKLIKFSADIAAQATNLYERVRGQRLAARAELDMLKDSDIDYRSKHLINDLTKCAEWCTDEIKQFIKETKK